MTWSAVIDNEMAAHRVGSLRDPRPRVHHARIVTWLMKASVIFRTGCVARTFQISDMYSEDAGILTQFLLLEMIVTSLVFLYFARWEDQEHWITLWQTLYTLEFLCVRSTLYNNPSWLIAGMAGLYVTYFIGIYTEFTKWELPRVPPFTMKKNDTKKQKFGWLGKSLAQWVNFKAGRMFVTLVMYLAGMMFGFFLLYAMFISDVDDFRNLPSYKDQFTNASQVSDDHASDVLHPVLLVGVFFAAIAFIPATLVEVGAIPGLVSDWWNFKKASRSYTTGVWDVCELDEDKDGPGSELKSILQKKVLDTTIVLPCYLPNEEDILPFVLNHLMKEYEKLAQHEQAEKCRKEVLVVFNSPNQHPEFPKTVAEWTEKYEARGFKLTVRENKESTSKCDNLNLACEIITTEVCVLNDADTMLDWTCIVRGSEHIRNGYDIAQATNTHCLYDRNGTPGDENERQCHPYGILITIGDATKPQNMSTQTPFKHAPFNGRGGFWRTSALQQVGFDHRTVGEDHDAGYRGCAYFGFKGILDMNMLCQEQQPPDCKALTSQRIRWETAALEMRRTFSWILRSPHYGRFETFVLLWGQLQSNCNLPFQSLPFQVAASMPIIMIKSWLSIYAFGFTSDAQMTLEQLCNRDSCVVSFADLTNPLTGNHFNVALPLPVALLAALIATFLLMNAFDFMMRVLTTRYRPRVMFFVYYGILKPMFVAPYFCYVQYWALYDYCWGGAKFIATARSPLSPKNEKAGLEKPLLPR
jgi:cellulose synthase/poly-beta-1,6-N-acetylglucosamine synthase-like glycosyltransferase